MVVASDADAIGLNFYEKSKRCVSHLDAGFIRHELGTGTTLVGVFVNESLEEVRSTAEHIDLDFVQLHGDESIEYIQALKGLRVIRALRMQLDRVEELKMQIAGLIDQTDNLHAILLDAYDPEAYGGTGKQVDWDCVAALDCFSEIPLILAGGLVPDNVDEAIRKVRPAAVDVASGVELSPGQKDRSLVERFARSAKQAFDACVG